MITRYLGTRSEPGYPNAERVFLLPVCCPLNSAFMAANLVQHTIESSPRHGQFEF